MLQCISHNLSHSVVSVILVGGGEWGEITVGDCIVEDHIAADHLQSDKAVPSLNIANNGSRQRHS